MRFNREIANCVGCSRFLAVGKALVLVGMKLSAAEKTKAFLNGAHHKK